jgi:ATP-dependent protease Clp ATPase subunit
MLLSLTLILARSPRLVTGPSGCGKTYTLSKLLSVLSEKVQLPYSIASATSLSATGYKVTTLTHNPSHASLER